MLAFTIHDNRKRLSDTLKSVFLSFDRDGNGTIEVSELANISSQLGHTLTEEEM
jgi:Ca2+-binding EF-hand superfamily protein